MMDRRRALMMAQGGAEPPFYINGYVGNGLEHYYDAIDNQGIGIERTTNANAPWIDLGNNPMSLPQTTGYGGSPWSVSNARILDQSWRTGGVCVKREDPERILDCSKPYSIEMRCRAGSDSKNLGWFPAIVLGTRFKWRQSGMGANEGADRHLIERAAIAQIKFNYANGEPTSVSAQTTPTTVLNGTHSDIYTVSATSDDVDFTLYHTFSITQGRDTLSFFIDGILVDAISAQLGENMPCYAWSAFAAYTAAITNGPYSTNTPANAIRLYSRELGSGEILSNYQNDLTRFAS